MIDKIILARATLVGLARTNVICARTPEALRVVEVVKTHNDYREGLPGDFGKLIRAGLIRSDARWAQASETQLVRLLEAQE